MNSVLTWMPTFDFRDPDLAITMIAAALTVIFGLVMYAVGLRRGRFQAEKLLEKGQGIYNKLDEILLNDEDFEGLRNEAEPIHHYFELSYAQYLGIPRSILQNMPVLWQRVFVGLLYKLDEHFDWRRPGMLVRFQNEDGRYMKDELADYERGRRALTPEDVHAISERARARYHGKNPDHG